MGGLTPEQVEVLATYQYGLQFAHARSAFKHLMSEFNTEDFNDILELVAEAIHKHAEALALGIERPGIPPWPAYGNHHSSELNKYIVAKLEKMERWEADSFPLTASLTGADRVARPDRTDSYPISDPDRETVVLGRSTPVDVIGSALDADIRGISWLTANLWLIATVMVLVAGRVLSDGWLLSFQLGMLVVLDTMLVLVWRKFGPFELPEDTGRFWRFTSLVGQIIVLLFLIAVILGLVTIIFLSLPLWARVAAVVGPGAVLGLSFWLGRQRVATPQPTEGATDDQRAIMLVSEQEQALRQMINRLVREEVAHVHTGSGITDPAARILATGEAEEETTEDPHDHEREETALNIRERVRIIGQDAVSELNKLFKRHVPRGVLRTALSELQHEHDELAAEAKAAVEEGRTDDASDALERMKSSYTATSDHLLREMRAKLRRSTRRVVASIVVGTAYFIAFAMAVPVAAAIRAGRVPNRHHSYGVIFTPAKWIAGLLDGFSPIANHGEELYWTLPNTVIGRNPVLPADLIRMTQNPAVSDAFIIAAYNEVESTGDSAWFDAREAMSANRPRVLEGYRELWETTLKTEYKLFWAEIFSKGRPLENLKREIERRKATKLEGFTASGFRTALWLMHYHSSEEEHAHAHSMVCELTEILPEVRHLCWN